MQAQRKLSGSRPGAGKSLRIVDLSYVCQLCGTSSTVQGFEGWPGFTPKYCDSCAGKIRARRERGLRDADRKTELGTLLVESAIPAGFHTWDTKLGNNGLLNWTRRHAEESLFVRGPNGIGKTRSVCRTAVERMVNRRETIAFVRCVEWFRDVTLQIGDDPKSISGILGRLKAVDVVIFDDLGKEKLTHRGAEILLDVVDARETAGRRIWITSNLGSDGLAVTIPGHYGQAVLERLRRACVPYSGPESEQDVGPEPEPFSPDDEPADEEPDF